ncbi:DUF6130 family protein [Chromobacterium subtsugae]|uniref:DUF6130 family protein n=1 Tax=Chromobacterium subtsugae TaxID=251747 RepID=UPI000B2434F4|nr:DUF6130 family protein [Chromobacterium subtsugae]
MTNRLSGWLALLALACCAPAQAADAPAPKLVIESPVDGQAVGNALIVRFHAEQIRLAPRYAPAGEPVPAALRGVGHLHVYLDGAAWHWVHATPDPLVLVGLPPGPHQIHLELAAPNHQPLDARQVSFSVSAGDSRRAH